MNDEELEQAIDNLQFETIVGSGPYLVQLFHELHRRIKLVVPIPPTHA